MSKSKTIRTDVWDISANAEQKRQNHLTVEEYRRYLSPLVITINAQWVNLADLTAKERVNAVEKIIHKTAGTDAG